MHGDSDQAKRQQEQPNNRIKHKRKKRKRPAKDEEYAPEKKSSHDNLAFRKSGTP